MSLDINHFIIEINRSGDEVIQISLELSLEEGVMGEQNKGAHPNKVIVQTINGMFFPEG